MLAVKPGDVAATDGADDAADAPREAAATPALAARAAPLAALAAGGRGVIRTPLPSIEIVTSRPLDLFLDRHRESCLPGGTGIAGRPGIAGTGGGALRGPGENVTSSLSLPLRGVARSASTNEAINKRIDSRMKRVEVMPTSQLP